MFFIWVTLNTFLKTFLKSNFAQILKIGSKYFLLVRVESLKSHIQPNSNITENKSLKIRKKCEKNRFLTTHNSGVFPHIAAKFTNWLVWVAVTGICKNKVSSFLIVGDISAQTRSSSIFYEKTTFLRFLFLRLFSKL